MSKVKEAYRKLNLKAAVVGGALIITTSIGTCQLTKPVEEPAIEETPLVVEEPAVETEPEAVAAEEPEAVEAE